MVIFTRNGGVMAVKLRLKKMGSKKRPFYRIVAADARSPRDGKFIEIIGTYDSIKQPAEVKIDKEKAIKWLNHGAQPTDTVKSLFKKEGISKNSKEV
jgi:small subunit ribosomal protein S16